MARPDPPSEARRLASRAVLFTAIGLLVYVVLLLAAEGLLYAHGDTNAFFKIATEERDRDDWVILGSSHAMPLGFGGASQRIETQTGLRVQNLAATGAGPLYNRFVLEQYLRTHRAGNVLYVVDSFAFYSREWNEDRFADAKLLARTPWKPATAAALAGYVANEGVSWRAWLDYVTGFSKVNNRDRFQPDRWEGETQFDRSWRPSPSAVKKRIDYLYPQGAPQPEFERHLAQMGRLVQLANAQGARVVLVKLPMPAAYRQRLPAGEAAFDASMARFAAASGADWQDLSGAFDEPKYFFDSDHLNRAGVERLLDAGLRALLTAPEARGRQP